MYSKKLELFINVIEYINFLGDIYTYANIY